MSRLRRRKEVRLKPETAQRLELLRIEAEEAAGRHVSLQELLETMVEESVKDVVLKKT